MKINLFLIFYSLFIISFPVLAQANSDPLSKCYKTTAHKNRTETESCLYDELKLSEQQLNVIYGKSKSDLEDIDFDETKTAIDALTVAQEYFVKFRTAECQRQSTLLIGGAIAKDIFIACEIKLNQWRAKSLLNN
ncbi:lysozyme inhibitor LprI family protein [Proteus myxofaciens]|uniref:UmoC family protein n=1 Tax=Proteus myxofaciens ATCC 19692 TaxID=1354337 RepID=A0A198GD88_9GAMM|nr:lysozyme inhibitor LprI family protein [Proteus myxofaciens]OAT35058.1 UmoC family protein [Proteus myxofaciens ATCC 19692]